MSKLSNAQESRQTREQQIEDSIRESIHQMTPDLLDSLMEELDLSQEDAHGVIAPPNEERHSDDERSDTRHTQPVAPAGLEAPASPNSHASGNTARKLRRPRNWYRLVLSAAAIFALVAVGFFAMAGQDRQTFAVVGLDVNPSVELSVDESERVISAEALNDDALNVLDGLELKGTELNTACHAVVSSMLVKGYLRTDSNSILVSIRAVDPQAGKQLEQRISQNLNSYLENSKVAVSILGQYVAEDEEVSKLANEQNISLGKAWLVRKILASDSKADEASLLRLSTQDLILLAQEKKVESESSIGTSDTSAFITEEKAAQTALSDAGVQKQDTNLIRVEFGCEDGKLVYEIEFNTNANAYEYDIDARSGQIVSAEVETRTAAALPEENGRRASDRDEEDHDEEIDEADNDDFDDDGRDDDSENHADDADDAGGFEDADDVDDVDDVEDVDDFGGQDDEADDERDDERDERDEADDD